jgi:hypothetical protein
VAAVDRLLDPAAWAEAVARVRPVIGEGEYERWTSAHEQVYRRALARSARQPAPR